MKTIYSNIKKGYSAMNAKNQRPRISLHFLYIAFYFFVGVGISVNIGVFWSVVFVAVGTVVNLWFIALLVYQAYRIGASEQ